MTRKGEGGAAAVEFALLLPVLMVILFGLIEFGFALFNQEVITNASREGARAGIVIGNPRPSEAEIKTVVLAYLTNFALSACDGSCITVTGAQGSSGNDLTVTVNYPYSFSVLPGFVGGFVSNITLRARTTMKQE